MTTGRYTLDRLIEVGRCSTRYLGRLPDGRLAEILLITDSQEIDFFARRLRLVELAANESFRTVLESKCTDDSMYVGMELLDSICVEKEWTGLASADEISSLLQTLVAVLLNCHRVGLVVGGVVPGCIFRSPAGGPNGVWKVDVTGFSSPLSGNGGGIATDLEWLPPEFRDSPGEQNLGSIDSTYDIYSLGILIDQLISNIGTAEIDSKVIEHWKRISVDCKANESENRPTASELLDEICVRSLHRNSIPERRSAQDISETQPGPTLSAPSDLDATMNADFSVAAANNYRSAREDVVSGLMCGANIGRYTIESKLGEGGMGAVYRAYDSVDHRTVAIKVLNRQVAQGSSALRRFTKEARMLAKVNNPYVANLFEINSEGDRPYMAVEFVDGGSLDSILRVKQALDEKFVLAILADALRGLAIAHARGIVHRDFKPENLLLTHAAIDWFHSLSAGAATEPSIENGAGTILAKVADFGLARASDQSESMAMTRDGAVLGTPLYMSPEQCRGEPARQPSDVYSVGATLFHMLTGNPPFQADSQVAVLHKHCNEPLPNLKQLRPDLSEALIATIEKCLAKNADARYQTAGELLVDIENLMRGKATSLGLHPPVLSLDSPDLMRFDHSWELLSSPAQLWPYVSNTDRVNHAIGLPAVKYTIRQDPVAGTQRFAEAVILGQRIRWQEHPYEWIEGRRLSVLREFNLGPFRWFVNVVELQPISGGGTRVVQSLIVTPRNWLGKQLARLQLGKKSKENFGRVYKQIDDYLCHSRQVRADSDPFQGRTELRPANRARLASRLDELRSHSIEHEVVEALGQYLEHASDLEVARIRPLAFAERFGLDSTQVVNACLLGSRSGLLTLLWDILCPSCRIPSDVQETLSAIKEHGQCEACNLSYELDLNRSIELIFRAHPEIRSVETKTYCIGGPAWSRHVVAQVRLAAGERFACDLEMPIGAYAIKGPRLPFAIDLRVGHTGELSRVEISLARAPVSRGPIQLPIGRQVICLLNDSKQDQQIRIERTASTHDALSAAQASTMALFRELFPGEVLAGGNIVSVAHVTVLQMKLSGANALYQKLGDAAAFSRVRASLEATLDAVKLAGGAVVKTVGEGVLASFSVPARAVDAALRIMSVHESRGNADSLSPTVAIHTGPAMAATMDDRLDYFGRTLQVLSNLVARAPIESIVLTRELLQQSDVQSLLAESHCQMVLEPGLSDTDDQIVYRIVRPGC